VVDAACAEGALIRHAAAIIRKYGQSTPFVIGWQPVSVAGNVVPYTAYSRQIVSDPTYSPRPYIFTSNRLWPYIFGWSSSWISGRSRRRLIWARRSWPIFC